MADYIADFLTTADGPKIEYRSYDPIGEVTGTPILCLHGLTRNLRDFEDIAPKLAGLGRRVISASQRGRGGSDFETDPARYSPLIYTVDMLALLDHLNISKALFLGTSMGGLMTMIAASADATRVHGAVLNDIGPQIDPIGLARIQGYVGKVAQVTSWADAAQQIQAINGPAFPKETDPSFWLDFAKKTFRETSDGQLILDYDPKISQSVAEGNTDMVDLWPLFDALAGIPTLVLRGGISDILSKDILQKMHDRKPDLQSVDIPNVGHAPTLAEPQSWAALSKFVMECG